ncbi:MAG TPA: methyltransferase domain-containing protein [Clostridiales bacterium]|jgi:caffeoyl-CoA O-methyltransferase|nr:methyltransferase domain-containing protein [Clostridiales bacterium]
MRLQDILKYCQHNNIPTISEPAWEQLDKALKKYKPYKILEIGTGSGYSAAKILNSIKSYADLKDISFTTVDIDPERFELALANLKSLGLYQYVELILEDAAALLGLYVLQNRLFDFIFLDGAKGQYINYLPNILKILDKDGILFCDNLSFYGLSKNGKNTYHKMRTIAVNLRKFEKALKKCPQLKCEIIKTGDDYVAICQKI